MHQFLDHFWSVISILEKEEDVDLADKSPATGHQEGHAEQGGGESSEEVEGKTERAIR